MTRKGPSVIDLFSGVGGLSLGASRSGFDIKLAVELDPHAYQSHKINFPNSRHSNSDVQKYSGDSLLQEAGLSSGQLDVLVGGPPCQGFSTMGSRDVLDPRNQLFWHFFRLVRESSPKIFLAENVPGLLNKKYTDIVGCALDQVRDEYDIYGPQIIKASDYGAPTTRTRVFFIGVKKGIASVPLVITNDSFLPVNVEQALRGLPRKINPDWQTEKQSWRSVRYKIDSPFFDKVVNQIPTGVGCQVALDKIQSNKVSGFLGTRHTDAVEKRYGALLPGQQDKISKATRLDKKGFCPTLRAGTGSDKGSHQAVRPIHPDQPRVITPREAARLQGFPDWFQFHPTKWHSFRQIGNSVSPIVAEAILSKIFQVLV